MSNAEAFQVLSVAIAIDTMSAVLIDRPHLQRRLSDQAQILFALCEATDVPPTEPCAGHA